MELFLRQLKMTYKGKVKVIIKLEFSQERKFVTTPKTLFHYETKESY